MTAAVGALLAASALGLPLSMRPRMSAQVAQMPPSSVHSSVAQLVDGLPPGADGAGEDSSRSSLQQDKKKGIGAGYRAAQGLMIMFQTMPPRRLLVWL